jgi:RHH-type rel operon transcriptional repressor/antitoxin RelB
MLHLRLPEFMEKSLQRLARRTGLTKSAQVREAISKHIENFEDICEAEKVWARVRSGKEKTYSFDEVARRLGLDE